LVTGRSAVRTLIHIVDDDQAIRDSLGLFLKMRGYDVAASGSGSAFFRDADLKRCCCVILDVNLPDETGFEVLSRLRGKGVSTPAIFMSGRATSTSRPQAERAKAVAFFDKPVNPGELLAAIAKATATT
jgi:two-component system, LuxR family, response regulator FixJ